MKQKNATRKLVLAGVLTALAVVGSMISFPVAGSKCAPVQHMVNILAAVTLGPGWGVGIAFCASLLRNVMGIGSILAFPGSMAGALCCGIVYMVCRRLGVTLLCRSVWDRHPGGFGSVPGSKILDWGWNRPDCLSISCRSDFYGSRQYSCLFADYDSGKKGGAMKHLKVAG